jgi:hypothetical protein
MSLAPIRAELVGDRCTAEGITLRAAAPALAICRALISAGYGPARPLHVFRGDVLALTVSSIGRGSRHTVRDNRYGTPILARYYDRPGGALPASPIAPIDPAEAFPATAFLALVAAPPTLREAA